MIKHVLVLIVLGTLSSDPPARRRRPGSAAQPSITLSDPPPSWYSWAGTMADRKAPRWWEVGRTRLETSSSCVCASNNPITGLNLLVYALTTEGYGFIEFLISNSIISTVFRQPLVKERRPSASTVLPAGDQPRSEKGEVPLRGVGTLRYVFPPSASVHWQPDGLTIHA